MRAVVSMLILFIAWASPAEARMRGGQGEGQVLLTPSQAVAEIFPGAASVARQAWTPDAAERAKVSAALGRAYDDGGASFLLVYDASKRFLGYAMVTEERGKYRPITFMVGLTPQLQVRGVAIMVYREDRGDEVKHRRFLAQYRGKTASSPLRVNRDITNISGATISVRSVTTGVRRVLVLAQAAFEGHPPALAMAAEARPLATLR